METDRDKRKTTKKKAAKTKSADVVSETEKLAKKLLKLMGLKAKPTVSEDKENNAVLVDIQTEEEAGLIIGNRGNNLNSIQIILSLMLSKRTGIRSKYTVWPGT